MRVAFLLFLFCGLVSGINVNVNAWASKGTDFIFPEKSISSLNSRQNSGVCFVGGGNRAFVGGAGQLRALSDLGLIDDIRYFVGISGGSSLVSAYAYRQNNNVDSSFLNQGHEPENLTLNVLSQAPGENTILRAPYVAQTSVGSSIFFGSNSEFQIAQYLLTPHNITESAQLWIDMMNRVYFNPIGVKGNESMAWNSSHVADIIRRNPNLANHTFVTPVEKSPYVIIGGTRVTPLELWPFDATPAKNTFSRIEFTPLYSGEPYSRSFTYYQDPRMADAKTVTLQTGGYIESYAFGGIPVEGSQSIPATGSGTVNVSLFTGLTDGPASFPIKYMTGISSHAPAAGFASPTYAFAPYNLPSGDLVPRIPMYPLHNLTQSPSETLVADGGSLENTGIISLVQRKVKNIIVFDNAYNSIRNDTNIQCLFGVGLNATENSNVNNFYAHNQIFPSSAYYDLIGQLLDKQAAGQPAIAVLDVSTVSNDWFGVDAGFSVHLTWVYLSAPTSWINRLPAETREAINNQTTGSTFQNFPNYPTSQFFLSASQINLLAELTNFIVRNQSDVIKKGLGISTSSAEGFFVSTIFVVLFGFFFTQ